MWAKLKTLFAVEGAQLASPRQQQLAELLYVPHSQFIRAKLRVLEGSDSKPPAPQIL